MIRNTQGRLSLFLLSMMIVTIVCVATLANTTPVIENHVAREVARHQSTNGLYLFDNGYIDDGDYLLVGQLPHVDYSRGGVYFIGASEMKTSIMPWTLPASERKLIHNYAIGDMRHSDARHFIRMLIKDDGLLQAEGRKTTVILGLSYQMARKRKERGGYVATLFPRHRHFTYDLQNGIRRVPLSRVERFLRLERDRANRFLRIVLLSPTRVSAEPQLYEWKVGHLTGVMRGNWRVEMAKEVGELAALIDYLQQRKVNVRAIFYPNGSWQASLPYDSAYRDLVVPILRSRGVPTSDYSGMLVDNEFYDSMHARYSGQVKLHEALRKLALQVLSEMGTPIDP